MVEVQDMKQSSMQHGPRSPRNIDLRRYAAADSVALPAQKKRKVQHETAQYKPLDIKRRVEADLKQHYSAESGIDSNATKWFEDANANVSPNLQSSTNLDNEPPFFIVNHSAFEPQPQASNGTEDLFGAAGHNNSENEDLRDVIDDLTVENRKLKHLLRSQKARHSSPSQNSDKLFEVRMHGMDPGKKRELEILLKNFATSMQGGASSVPSSPTTKESGLRSTESLTSTGAAPVMQKVHTDSGYASNSGMMSDAASNSGKARHPTSNLNKKRTIKTYLHDIPDSLLPHRPVVMSERLKMVLVVRKLEQLFTGKQAAPGEHQQPVQQQEISQSAAQADRQEDVKHNRRRRPEGARESHILPFHSAMISEAEHSPEKQSQIKQVSEGSDTSNPESSSANISRAHSPDQRPTRPLDLDIDRSMVPSENIDYLRHLGLSSPHLDRASGGDESWLYLNLLINMAQLHTMNVTPDFIRRAIQKMSKKFELSKDRQQVRWKGSLEGTKFSKADERALKASDSTPHEMTGYPTSGGGSRSKAGGTHASPHPVVSLSHSESNGTRQRKDEAMHAVSPIFANSKLPNSGPILREPTSGLGYKPMFRESKSVSSLGDDHLTSSSSHDDQYGGSSDLGCALSRSNLNKRHTDEATITFYNNPYFFSDSSSDNAPANLKRGFSRSQEPLLGVPIKNDWAESSLRYHDACYFTPQFAKRGFEISEDDIMAFSPQPLSTAGQEEVRPLELPVSGLGGVTPQDNFALDVRLERTINKASRGWNRHLTGTTVHPNFEYRVVDASMTGLQPAQLPSPSYIFFSTGSSSGTPDVMYMSEDSESDSSAEEDYPAPPAFLGNFSRKSLQSKNNSSEISSDEDSDDYESVDILCAARSGDPAKVAAQEREYLLNHQGGSDPIAASLAATVGAGTESSSLASDIASDADEYGSEMSTDD